MKRILLAFGLLVGLAAPALAQSPCGVNFVPTGGVVCSTVKQNTFSAASLVLAPASAATDILCISGSATKSISLIELDISGIGQATVTPLVSINHHTILDTGGTNATGGAVPTPLYNAAAATPLVATAVVSAFTANPTINDTAPVPVRAAYFTLTTSASVAESPLLWVFGSAGTDEYTQRLDLLKGVTGQYCVNLNGATTNSSLAIALTWTEN